MKKTRYDALVNSLTGIARKVFNAVPAREHWTSKEIYAELRRNGHTTADLRIIQGCLDSLVDTGLVREFGNGEFCRITPKENSAAVDDTSDALDQDPIEHPSESPEPQTADATEHTGHVRPYTIIEVPSTFVRDHDYEFYLNLRLERIQDALTVLADHVEAETGLALLEIVEDMDDVHLQMLEYDFERDQPTERRIVMQPGWYEHLVDDGDFVMYTHDPEPPSASVIDEARQREIARNAAYIETHKESIAGGLAVIRAESEARIDAVFRKFEPDGEMDRPYYNSLLDKLKNRIPDLNTDTSDEHLAQIRSKPRRGICDVKIEGVSQSHEYRAWVSLISPQSTARRQELGLDMEVSWLNSFKTFLKDVGYKPHYKARLVRIDKEKGWYKENMEWRVGGQMIPARIRRPDGWPLNYGRVAVAKNLDRSCRDAVNEILRPRQE